MSLLDKYWSITRSSDTQWSVRSEEWIEVSLLTGILADPLSPIIYRDPWYEPRSTILQCLLKMALGLTFRPGALRPQAQHTIPNSYTQHVSSDHRHNVTYLSCVRGSWGGWKASSEWKKNRKAGIKSQTRLIQRAHRIQRASCFEHVWMSAIYYFACVWHIVNIACEW
jgi:hypothetical protein